MSQLPKEEVELSATDIQQQFYEAMADADWELYEMKERKYLLQKIGIALCGPPTKEGNLEDGDDLKLQGYGVREEEICMTVFNKICRQAESSFNGKNVVISIIRVVLVTPKEVGIFKRTPDDHWDNLHLKKGKNVTICVFHVFCVRKCTIVKSGGKSCRIYIDHDGRVYQNWDSYLEKNLLPKGVMVVPENGEYRGSVVIKEINNDEDLDKTVMPKVKLTVVLSPALGLGAKVLHATDITSTVANIGALGTLIGAAFATPVVAPFLIAGAVGTSVVTGIYAIVRASMNLADRGKHEQNIGLDDSEARNHWINIVMSTVGISFSAAAKLVAWAASTGTNLKILMNALQFLKYTNLATGIVGVANSLGDMIINYTKYKKAPSGLEIFQFTTSALFLGIGVMSNATAQDIVMDAQATTINEARDALSSNVKRKAFDKVTAENRRTLGTINGNAETIRALQVITDKDDFFAKIARMNKDMNKNKVRVSLTSEGKTLINNQHKVSLAELYGMGKGGRNKLFSKLGPADTSTKNAPTRISTSYGNNSTKILAKDLKIYVRVDDVLIITQFLLKLSKVDQDFVAEILSQLSANIHDAFLLVCVEVSKKLPGDSNLNAFIVYFIFEYIKSQISDCDLENDSVFEIVLKTWVKNGRVDKDTILKLKDRIVKSLSEVKIGEFHNNPQNFDYIHEFRKRHKRFLVLKAGEEIPIGHHTVVVKSTTVQKLGELLKDYSQKHSDVLLDFTFMLISLLTAEELFSLILLNPDEDIIYRVVHYLMHEVIVTFILVEFEEKGTMQKTVLVNMKNYLLEWRSRQEVRKYKSCESCSGIYFEN